MEDRRGMGGGLPGGALPIAGLGIPGRFGPGDLTVLVRELCWAAGRLGRQHVATVLIGSGNGNLSELTAVASWLHGIGEALAGQVDGAPRVERITLVERDPERLLNIDDALTQLTGQLRDDILDVTYTPLSDAKRAELERRAAQAAPTRRRRVQSTDDPVPTRITLSRDGRAFRFGAITATAAVPERDVPVDPKLVEEANDQLAGEVDGERRRDRGRFLGRLLFPRDLRDQLEGDAPVVMILDSTTARIHWELVARMPATDPGGNGNPDSDFLGVSPRALQLVQLPFHGTTLGILVGRHLERESVHKRKPEQKRARLTGDGAATPERTIRDVQRESFGGGRRGRDR